MVTVRAEQLDWPIHLRSQIGNTLIKGAVMDDHVYKNIEITGTSAATVEDAIRKAIARAAQTVQNMRWFEVVDTRGTIEDGRVARWQVTIKVGFTLND
jgi:flavin-binding protein dodecin